MDRSGQVILFAALMVLLGLLVGLTLSTVAAIRSPGSLSSEFRLVPIGYLVLGVLIVAVVRTLRDR